MNGYLVEPDLYDPSRWVLLRWHGAGWEIWDRGRGRWRLRLKLWWYRLTAPVPRRLLP